MNPIPRPPEGHALRRMKQEGLEAALETCRNARLEAHHAKDPAMATLYSRQAERIRVELQMRLVERERDDRLASEAGHWPEVEVRV